MKIRLLRGQVVIREIKKPISDVLWTPDGNARKQKTHRGEVLSMGPPALTLKGHEIPHGFKVGDVVAYHWSHHEKAFTRPWSDGLDAQWIPQANVDGVYE